MSRRNNTTETEGTTVKETNAEAKVSFKPKYPDEIEETKVLGAIKKNFQPRKDVEVKKGEEDAVHVEMCRWEADKFGNPMFKPQLHKFNVRIWETILANPGGLSVFHVHHLPKGAISYEEFCIKRQKNRDDMVAKYGSY